jgi:hypothetical protein
VSKEDLAVAPAVADDDVEKRYLKRSSLMDDLRGARELITYILFDVCCKLQKQTATKLIMQLFFSAPVALTTAN